MTPPPRRGKGVGRRPPAAVVLPLSLLLSPGTRIRPGASSSSSAAVLASAAEDDATSGNKCGLYLAPSSTNPEDDDDEVEDASKRPPPKLGLYAGREYSPLDVVGYPEIAIQVYDMEGHTGRSALSPEEKGEYDDEEDEDEDEQHVERPPVKPEHVNHFRFALSQLWTPDSTGAKYDTSEFTGGHGHTYTSIPGVGMLGNFHPGITNADWNQRSCLDRAPLTDGASSSAAGRGRDHPGRGAFSEYYDVTVRATRTIPRGMEIFMDFGAEWSKENTEEGEATEEDYLRADRSVDAILGFLDKYDSDLTPELSADIYRFLIDDVIPLGSETEERADVQRSLLPKDVLKLRAVKETGGSLRHRNPSVFRDVEWLEENGQCMDNIRPGPSAVPYAGRGAFAARRIGRGELVSPMPLVHIPHGRELDMYELTEGINEKAGDEEVLVRSDGADASPTGKQLLLNYCFGHPDSDVLLYPFGTASNFINHQPGGRANARIVWSASSASSKGRGLKIHRPEWLKVPPSELSGPEYQHVGLAFDVVAARDIREGEEVFLDYGTEWQSAWDEHVRKFEEASEKAGGSGRRADGRAEPTALELNALHHGRRGRGGGNAGEGDDDAEKIIRPFLTPRELRRDPYPDRVRTACHVSYREIEEGDGVPDDQRYVDGLKAYQWTDDAAGGAALEHGEEAGAGAGGAAKAEDVWKGASMRLCEILARVPIYSDDDSGGEEERGEEEEERAAAPRRGEPISYNYTTKVTLEEDSDDASESKVVRAVPHAAVRFVDRPYRGDQHRSDAFRHWIGVPDDMFPEAWRRSGSGDGGGEGKDGGGRE